MPNKNYLSGRRLEYEIVHAAKRIGGVACRTAGSHGWIDVIAKVPFNKGFLSDFQLEDEGPVMSRVKGKYKDTLYFEIYGGLAHTLYLLQCKRKKLSSTQRKSSAKKQ